MQHLLSFVAWLVAGFIFAAFDAYFYGGKVQTGKLNVKVYRVMQLALQFAIYYGLTLLPTLVWFRVFGVAVNAALVAFMLTHWAMGYDYWYYVFKNFAVKFLPKLCPGMVTDNYLTWDKLDWFKGALPQLYTRALDHRWINGAELKEWGTRSLIFGAALSLLLG